MPEDPHPLRRGHRLVSPRIFACRLTFKLLGCLSGPASAGIRPVIHGPAPEGDGLPAVVSRCLSAAGIRFPAILSRLVFRPSYDRPTGTMPDHDGVSTFRTREMRPDRAPSLSRD